VCSVLSATFPVTGDEDAFAADLVAIRFTDRRPVASAELDLEAASAAVVSRLEARGDPAAVNGPSDHDLALAVFVVSGNPDAARNVYLRCPAVALEVPGVSVVNRRPRAERAGCHVARGRRSAGGALSGGVGRRGEQESREQSGNGLELHGYLVAGGKARGARG